ncbi:uncharacterized protein VTP21DRAFT_7546 [Calcarisporiella thermophila]|uniref:uncharacterized protein n=1 Tax=Calcarisporiella thermophila TaxID=911321 RepID=UPI00374396E8
MKAYLYDNLPGDQRLPHQMLPSFPVSIDDLRRLGVLYYKLDGMDALERVEDICQEREYKNRDEITISKEYMGEKYESMISIFFEEHMHDDEEIRYILDGSGYFDVRDLYDRWVRIRVEPGDLLILPAGIYHRFTLDTNNYIKAMRLFKENPIWKAIKRPAEDNPARQAYVRSIGLIINTTPAFHDPYDDDPDDFLEKLLYPSDMHLLWRNYRDPYMEDIPPMQGTYHAYNPMPKTIIHDRARASYKYQPGYLSEKRCSPQDDKQKKHRLKLRSCFGF